MNTEEIFLAEDDESLLEFLTAEIAKHRYRVRATANGRAALAEIRKQPPDLIILDLILPEIDGLEICRLLKSNRATATIPILILTGLGREEERVKGLESGADGYLVKPFSFKELIARIRALLRRTRMGTEVERALHLQIGPLAIDLERHTVRMDDRNLKLTPTEFHLLKYLAEHVGKVFTRDHLITTLWGSDQFIEEHNLDVHIYSLRRKLESNPLSPRLLMTIRGIGYKIQIPQEIEVAENAGAGWRSDKNVQLD